MRVGILGLQQTLVVRLSTFGKADKTVAFSHLETDAIALVFVAAHLAVGFLVAIGGLGVLLASKGKVGILCRVSSLCVKVGTHEDEKRRHDDQDISSHRCKFSLLQTRNTRFYYWAKVQHFGETAKEFGKNVSVGPQKTTKFLIN